MSELDKSVALILYILGYPQHRIAALMDVNQGRISEIVQQIRRELSEKNGND